MDLFQKTSLFLNELDVVDWFNLFSGRGMDCCVDLFYEIVWSCFEKHVPRRFSRGGRKLPWITSEQIRRRKLQRDRGQAKKDF
jgi:hypothetical protein